MEIAEKSEVSKKESVSYDSKKDTSKRPELKSSVMAKKVERKLYPEPQVERKVSVVEVKAPVVVEVIKEEEEEVELAEPGTEGAAVEETENSGSGSSKVSFSNHQNSKLILIYHAGEQGPPQEVREGREADRGCLSSHSTLRHGRLRLPFPQPLPWRRQEEGSYSRAP